MGRPVPARRRDMARRPGTARRWDTARRRDTGRWPTARRRANGHPPRGVTAKSPGVAVLLTFLWLGAGHLYANRTGIGVCLLLFEFFVLVPLLFVFGVGILLWLVTAPIAMITAASAARNFNARNGIVVR